MELDQVREAIGYVVAALYPDFPCMGDVPETAKETVEEIFNTRIDSPYRPAFLNNAFYDDLVCKLVDSSICCFLDRYPCTVIRRVEIINQHGEFYVYS